MKQRFYQLETPVEGSEPLVQMANQILRKVDMLRTISAPSSTSRYKDKKLETANAFYECCLLEIYLHSAVEHLRKWKEDAIKYNNEFQGSWKYYAIADRLDCIKQYGGEDDDYNEDGSVRTKCTNKELEGSSILYSWRGYNNIFLSSKVEDFAYISTVIQNHSKFSITNLFREMGKPLTTYKQDAQGNMIPQDWADEQMSNAQKEFIADGMVDFLTLFVKNCRTIIDQVEKLPYNKDHKDFFESLPHRIDAILDLKLSPL